MLCYHQTLIFGHASHSQSAVQMTANDRGT